MITVNAEHVQTLRVMDMLGRTVLFQKNNVSTLDLSSLPNGCYSVLVQSDPGNSVHRVVKQ
ncbi:MAG: T9SS type A sorting domain-containing protein [Flavobacteriales bacterium]|nr:T9SS type A sorting domain-containing protein [Flavobacteriales bacterium]